MLRAKQVNPQRALAALIVRCGGIQAAATELGCSRQFVWRLANGKKQFSENMLAKLGLRRTVVAVEK